MAAASSPADAVLIVGGGGGVGAAVARRAARDGYAVIVADLSAAAARQVAQPLGASWAEIDVTDPAGVDNVFRSLGEELYAVVNCAAVHMQRLLAETPPDAWDRIQSVNARGTFLTCRSAAPLLCAKGRGRLVNMVTRLGFGNPYSSAYMASKHAVWGLTQSLAVELADYGVTVNAVAPGHIGPGTGMERHFRDKARALGLPWKDFEAAVLRNIPLGRWCRPDDVAGAVAYVLRPEAAFVTGEIINVTGGFTGYSIAPRKAAEHAP